MAMSMGNMAMSMGSAQAPPQEISRQPGATGQTSASRHETSQDESGEASEKVKRFCAQCGAAIQPNDRFCAYCGAQLTP